MSVDKTLKALGLRKKTPADKVREAGKNLNARFAKLRGTTPVAAGGALAALRRRGPSTRRSRGSETCAAASGASRTSRRSRSSSRGRGRRRRRRRRLPMKRSRRLHRQNGRPCRSSSSARPSTACSGRRRARTAARARGSSRRSMPHLRLMIHDKPARRRSATRPSRSSTT